MLRKREIKKLPLIAPWCFKKAPEELREKARKGELTKEEMKKLVPNLVERVKGEEEDRIEKYLLTEHNKRIFSMIGEIQKKGEINKEMMKKILLLEKDVAAPAVVERIEEGKCVVKRPDGLKIRVDNPLNVKPGDVVFVHQGSAFLIPKNKAREYEELFRKFREQGFGRY